MATARSKSPKSTKGALRVLIAHGVNLDLLGKREPEIYGSLSLAAINSHVESRLEMTRQMAGLTRAVELEFFQSNSEGDFLNKLSEGWDGCVINAGAWTHTSLAIADRLRGLRLPYVEVHLSNLARRESFRHRSFLAPDAIGVVQGLGVESYVGGLYGLLQHLAQK